LPKSWVDLSFAPSTTNDSYGLLWWLNKGASRHKAAPQSSVFALGAGNNMIWIDPEHDLVTVLRWIDKAKVDGFLERLVAAVKA
jgi:CubicO group peptidase (beta-lactamase class C family)